MNFRQLRSVGCKKTKAVQEDLPAVKDKYNIEYLLYLVVLTPYSIEIGIYARRSRNMFNRREREIAELTSVCAEMLPEHVWRLSEIDRACALFVATSTLGVLGEMHGEEILTTPSDGNLKVRTNILRDLFGAVANLSEQVGEGDEAQHAMRYLAGLEIAALALGHNNDPKLTKILATVWTRIRLPKDVMLKALQELDKYGRQHKVDALPRLNGKHLNVNQIMAAAKFVPPAVREVLNQIKGSQ